MDIKEILRLKNTKLLSAIVQDMSEDDKKEEHILHAKDDFDLEFSSNNLTVIFERKIVSKKKTDFCIQVKIKMDFDISSGDEEWIKESITENKDGIINRILNRAASEASLIIAQLSKYMGIGPLISSPIYQEKKI